MGPRIDMYRLSGVSEKPKQRNFIIFTYAPKFFKKAPTFFKDYVLFFYVAPLKIFFSYILPPQRTISESGPYNGADKIIIRTVKMIVIPSNDILSNFTLLELVSS